MIRNLRCTVTTDSVLANSKTQNAFLFTVNAIFRHDYPLAVEPGNTLRSLVQKKLGEILYLLICTFLPCLSWLLCSRVRKSRRDLWITLYIMCVIIRKRISCNYCESQVIVMYGIVQITFQVNHFLVVVVLLYLHHSYGRLSDVQVKLSHVNQKMIHLKCNLYNLVTHNYLTFTIIPTDPLSYHIEDGAFKLFKCTFPRFNL